MTRLDIISDPICPWCYIGKARLEKALAKNPDHPFDIHWQPFQLNPDMPPEGMDRRSYLEMKFGGRAGAIEVYAEIAKAAEAEGLEIAFEKIKRTPNTIDAHRLIHWAGLEGVQTPVVTRLFDGFFREGLDISDHKVLVDIARDTGMDADAIARLLETDADLMEVRAQDAKAREMGVKAVPTFIIANEAVVTGAQPTQLWDDIIRDILAQTAG